MTENNKRGKFIVIEGGEGSGKSSQIKALKEKYGDRILITREPGGSPYAEEIRDVMLNSKNAGQADARTHFALIWASRHDHMINTILPALEEGRIVVSDRFDSSTYAYQIYGQNALELKSEFFYFRDFFVGERKPDVYIYLDVEPEIGLSRKANGDVEINHFDERDLSFHNNVKKGYFDFLEQVPSVIIDSNPSFEEVQKSLFMEVEKITG
jgi:dTMP kinase